MKRPPEKLPDPWLFDSEKLLRELARCRELIVAIPVNGDAHATHFAINIAIDANWNLEQNLRFLLQLHREGQRRFSRRFADEPARAQGNPTRGRRTGRPRVTSSAA